MPYDDHDLEHQEAVIRRARWHAWRKFVLGTLSVLGLIVIVTIGAPAVRSAIGATPPALTPAAQSPAAQVAHPTSSNTLLPEPSFGPTADSLSSDPLASESTPGFDAAPELSDSTAADGTTALTEATAAATTTADVTAVSASGVPPAGRDCPAAYPMKGRTRLDGKHVILIPADLTYKQARPDRCFATIADAVTAGYTRTLQ